MDFPPTLRLLAILCVLSYSAGGTGIAIGESAIGLTAVGMTFGSVLLLIVGFWIFGLLMAEATRDPE